MFDEVALSRTLLSVAWAPIHEEILFRGMLYRHLRDRWRWPVAVLASAGVFAAMHRSPALGVNVNALVGGLGYAALREGRGSLVAPIVAHMTTNLIPAVLGP
jgi:membrane protease YdiL (CAAX protease family)